MKTANRYDVTLLQTDDMGTVMETAQKRTFSLPPKQARFIDSQVRRGVYASGSEVVRAGLRALQERDAAVERWLKKDVAPVFDAMMSDPKRGMSSRKVSAALRAHHQARQRARTRDA